MDAASRYLRITSDASTAPIVAMYLHVKSNKKIDSSIASSTCFFAYSSLPNMK